MKKQKYLIFLAEDNRIYADLLQAKLELSGMYQIKKFLTGEDMLQQMALMPDVIILDYYMDSENSQAMNGLEVLKELNKKNNSIPVLFVSSLNNQEEIEHVKQQGAAGFLRKDAMLFEKLENCLRQMIQLSESEKRQSAVGSETLNTE